MVIDKLPNEGYSKRFLAMLFLAVLTLPLIPVTYVLKVGDSYVAVNLRYCFPRNPDEGLYSCLLLQELLFAAGTTCLLLVIFKLIKVLQDGLTCIVSTMTCILIKHVNVTTCPQDTFTTGHVCRKLVRRTVNTLRKKQCEHILFAIPLL